MLFLLGATLLSLATSTMSGAFSAPSTDVSAWNNVILANSKTSDLLSSANIDLVSLGEPISVSTQIVAGINYQFTFQNGIVLQFFDQSWTNTLELTCVDK